MWKEKKRHITFKYQVTKKNHSIKKKKLILNIMV